MFRSRTLVLFLVLIAAKGRAQQLSLGNTPFAVNKAAVLELNSSRQGLLLPRLSDTTGINALNPPDGMVVYYTPSKQFLLRANGYWNALTPAASLSSYWSTGGNANGAVKSFGNTDNFDLSFITANAERMRLTATGRLGIGTTSPSSLLHLAGTNPLSLTGVQTGTNTTADSLLTINNGLVQKLPVATFQNKLSGTGFVKSSGGAISYDNSTYTVANAAIVGATKTKITYDSKGLVTAGADATTTDIAEGTNLYYADARVRAAALTGLSTATATAVTATDNVLGGMGKLQGQINAINGAGYLTGNQSITWTASGDATGAATGTTSLSPSLTVTGLRGAALPSLSNGFLKYNGSAWTFDNNTYLTSETSTLANVTGRGNTTATGIQLTQNGNTSTSYSLYLKRSTDVSPLGNLIRAQNAAATTDLFRVDASGNTTANTFIKSGGTSSQFLKADGSVDNNTYLTGNQSTSLTGDVTGSGTTTISTSIGANKVTLGHMAQVANGSFLGRTSAGTGNVEALTAAQAKTLLGLTGTNSGDVSLAGQNYLSLSGQTITANAVDLSGTHAMGTLAAARFGALTGDVTNTAGSYATTISAGAVTYGKMQNVSANNRLLGRATAGAGSPEEIVLGSGFSMSGNTLSVTAGANTWNTLGNAGTSWATNFLGTTDNQSLRLRTANAQRLIIDSLGRVGIGVTNPTNPLVVKDTMEIRRTGSSVSSLLFSNTSGTGDFRIGGDGGDIFWQGGGGRSLQTGAYWTMILAGDRQQTSFPSFVNGTGGTGVLIPAQRTASVPLAVQAISGQTANLMEWRSPTGSLLGGFNSNGYLGIGVPTFDGTNPEKLLINGGNTNSFNLIRGVANINNYLQFNIQNTSSGTKASTDIVATADNGSESINYVDLGINGSSYNGGYFGDANDAYLYSTGQDFVIGNATVNKGLYFLTGGSDKTANARLVIAGNGNVGVGTTTPNTNTKLDVNGAIKIGTIGTVINNVLAFEGSFNVNQSITAGTAGTNTFTAGFTDVTLTLSSALTSGRATVTVSPNFDLPQGVSIAYARATSATAIKVRFVNSSTATGTIVAGSKLYFTVVDY